MVQKQDDRLITRSEVEAQFGVSKRYLETCVYKGEGPPMVKIGRMVRYRPSDIRAWIEQHTFDAQGRPLTDLAASEE